MTLGEKLRQAREERDISISEVAEHTRISPLYLKAIEEDDYSTLPGGIFNKGFIKSFAKYVGVDENEAMQDYARQYSSQARENGEDGEPKTYRPEVLTDDRSSGSNIPTIIFAVLILGLMTWGILALVGYIQNQQNQTANIDQTANTSNTNQAANIENVNAPAPIPSTDQIDAVIKTSGADVSVSYQTDGTGGSKLVTQNAPLDLEAKNNLKFSFAKSLASDVGLTLNGKEIKVPTQPANPRRIAIEIEINKENIEQILREGEIRYGSNSAP